MSPESNLRIVVQEQEMHVPILFARFSTFVGDYLKTMTDDGGNIYKIPIPGEYVPEQVELILKFFCELKDHPLQVVIQQQQPEVDANQSEDELDSDDEIIDELNDGTDEESDQEPDEEPMEKKESSPEKPVVKDENAHVDAKVQLAALPDWAKEFFAAVPRDLLFTTLKLASYLSARPFVDHGTFFIADKLKSMSVKEMRAYLGVEMDFQKGEFDLLANETKWLNQLVEAGIVDESVLAEEKFKKLSAEEGDVKPAA